MWRVSFQIMPACGLACLTEVSLITVGLPAWFKVVASLAVIGICIVHIAASLQRADKLLAYTWPLLAGALFFALGVWANEANAHRLRIELKEVRKDRQAIEVKLDQMQITLIEMTMNSRPETVSLPPPAGSRNLKITEPSNGQEVSSVVNVRGTVSDPQATVFLVVHPEGLRSYWVQVCATVEQSGAWEASAFIGRAGNQDIGKQFEILAVVPSADEELSEGTVLGIWPRALWTSEVVTITRK